jgi:hypothetical protein
VDRLVGGSAMTAERHLLLDREALEWFRALVCGWPEHGPERWNGAASARMLPIARLWRMERAFEMAYKFKPLPKGDVPPARSSAAREPR